MTTDVSSVVTTDVAETTKITIESQDGTPLALWKAGTGPSLLAVHGTGADHTAWISVVPHLTGSFTVYAMDRRGRGGSGDRPDYALEREFDDVAAAVDALPAPVHLYGHSFGGACALEAALRTGNLGSLALYEGGGFKPPGLRFGSEEFIAQLEELIAAGRADDALTTFMLQAAGVTPEELPIMRRHPAWAARVAAAGTVPRELRAINDYGGPDPATISTLRIPTLLIVGSETDSRRREMFLAASRVLPQARVAELSGQRHAAHQTAPELLASTLRNFIGSL